MKITNIIMGCVAASKSSVFTLNGGETLDQLDTMLATVTNGTVDDIEAQISLFQLARTNRQEAPTIAEQRKFRNLKILVLWLQKEQKFGRFATTGAIAYPREATILPRVVMVNHLTVLMAHASDLVNATSV